MVRTRHPDIRIDLGSLWKKVRESVKADLHERAWRQAILRAAEELEALLFARNSSGSTDVAKSSVEPNQHSR
jgi:hypothetical protein